jgi:homoserine kinase
MIMEVTVKVPATTANLGAGFDCIGAALTLYNEFTYRVVGEDAPPVTINVVGKEQDRVLTDNQNLAYQSFLKIYQTLGQNPPPIQIDINLGIPLARGLGSSATAIVGGLVAGNKLAGTPLNQVELMDLAVKMEGHPDNVVPALIGGCRLAATKDMGWSICDIPWDEDIVPVVAIPDFELSTEEARSVLPTTYSRADAIFNVAHLGLLIRGLATGNREWLTTALNDRIHQPYRQSLIRGYAQVYESAIAAHAYGLVISGAGPTLLALSHHSQADQVRESMGNAWQSVGVNVEVHCLAIDRQGTTTN